MVFNLCCSSVPQGYIPVPKGTYPRGQERQKLLFILSSFYLSYLVKEYDNGTNILNIALREEFEDRSLPLWRNIHIHKCALRGSLLSCLRYTWAFLTVVRGPLFTYLHRRA